MDFDSLKRYAATFVAVTTAMSLALALLWSLWFEPRVQEVVGDSEGRVRNQLAQLAGAMASGDTALAGFMAKYGVPQGPPGR